MIMLRWCCIASNSSHREDYDEIIHSWSLTMRVVACLFVTLAVGMFSMSATAANPTTILELRLALERPGRLASYQTQSSWDCFSQEKHKNTEHANSTNKGTVHGCQFTEGGCTDHTCAETFAAVDLPLKATSREYASARRRENGGLGIAFPPIGRFVASS